ncbi:hypothetical protein E2X65_10965 [Salmonella enterica]|nr:hypothetical protein [Salmonella enterica]
MLFSTALLLCERLLRLQVPGFRAETTVLTGAGTAIVVTPSTQQQISDSTSLYLIPDKRNIVNQTCLRAGPGILAVRALSRQQNGDHMGSRLKADKIAGD